MLDIGWFIEDYTTWFSDIFIVTAIFVSVMAVGAFICVFRDKMLGTIACLILMFIGIIVGFGIDSVKTSGDMKRLDAEISDVLAEEGGLDSAPDIEVANDIRALAGGGGRNADEEFRGELGSYAERKVFLSVDGESYLTELIFTIDGDDLNIGVLNGSTERVTPLSPEAVLGNEKVEALAK